MGEISKGDRNYTVMYTVCAYVGFVNKRYNLKIFVTILRIFANSTFLRFHM